MKKEFTINNIRKWYKSLKVMINDIKVWSRLEKITVLTIRNKTTSIIK